MIILPRLFDKIWHAHICEIDCLHHVMSPALYNYNTVYSTASKMPGVLLF